MKLDSAKVRWHRDRLGWTLDTLAEQAEVAEGTALRAEHGEDIRPSSGRRIARALGVDISELVPDQPGVVIPKVQQPPPKEIAAAVSETVEQVASATSEVTQEAAGASDEEDVNVIHLESRDDIAKYVSEVVWNLPEAEDKRLVINIYEDDSADIHIVPVSSTTEHETRKKRAEK